MRSETSVIDVILQSDLVGLSEVVVTALGISRQKKSLGYATQQVNGDAVSTVKTENFINTLSGKIAGVTLKLMVIWVDLPILSSEDQNR